MFRMFRRWVRRARIRRAMAVRRRLRRSYGAKETYTASQVKAAARRSGANGATAAYAFAIFCNSDEFARAGVEGEYDALRGDVDALFPRLGGDFAAREGVSDSDAVSIGGSVDGGSSDSGGGFGGGDGGGDGGGGGGGGF